jgi:hypothetical protein
MDSSRNTNKSFLVHANDFTRPARLLFLSSGQLWRRSIAALKYRDVNILVSSINEIAFSLLLRSVSNKF